MNFRELLLSLPFETERSICARLNIFFHRRPSSAPFISGDTFRSWADIIIENDNEFSKLKTNKKQIQNNSIIFIHTDFLRKFGDEILPEINSPFTLITHQSDYIITEKYKDIADNPYLKKWFAENVDLQHSKIIPIPIGLENQYYHNSGNISSFKKLKKQLKKDKIHKITKVMVALNLSTNPDKRFACYKAFWHKTIANLTTNFTSSSLYRKEAAKCMFIASPSGNGLDCHRTWEAIYLESIPIVEDNYMHRYFRQLGLPLILIRDWNDFASKSKEELFKIYNQMMLESDLSKAYAKYWELQVKQ